ncbi:MAG: aldo/keto reductase [Clostridia bacterium]
MDYTAKENRYSSMQYARSGKSGLALPRISLGLWHNFGSNANIQNMTEMLTTAFDNGITHFDLANNYGPVDGSAEENFGKIMSQTLRPYRDELIISTKAGYKMWDGPYGDGGSRKYILASLDQSLKRMQMGYVDIFYHHRMDKNTPLEESMMALDTAVKSGKALYAGISNYDTETMLSAIDILKDLRCPFVINQVRYSILDRHIESDKLKENAYAQGCGLITFSPLAQGILSEKYLDGVPDNSRIKTDGRFLKVENLTPEKMQAVRKLDALAGERGQSLSQMALSWILKDKYITSVLVGASNSQQILSNIGALKNCGFTREELNNIDMATKDVCVKEYNKK